MPPRGKGSLGGCSLLAGESSAPRDGRREWGGVRLGCGSSEPVVCGGGVRSLLLVFVTEGADAVGETVGGPPRTSVRWLLGQLVPLVAAVGESSPVDVPADGVAVAGGLHKQCVGVGAVRHDVGVVGGATLCCVGGGLSLIH